MGAKFWKILGTVLVVPLGLISRVLGLIGNADTGSQMASGTGIIPSIYTYIRNPDWWFPFLTALGAVTWIVYLWRKEIAALVKHINRESNVTIPSSVATVGRDGLAISGSNINAVDIIAGPKIEHHYHGTMSNSSGISPNALSLSDSPEHVKNSPKRGYDKTHNKRDSFTFDEVPYLFLNANPHSTVDVRAMKKLIEEKLLTIFHQTPDQFEEWEKYQLYLWEKNDGADSELNLSRKTLSLIAERIDERPEFLFHEAKLQTPIKEVLNGATALKLSELMARGNELAIRISKVTKQPGFDACHAELETWLVECQIFIRTNISDTELNLFNHPPGLGLRVAYWANDIQRNGIDAAGFIEQRLGVLRNLIAKYND